MRKVRDVLRLSATGMSKRKIAASLGVSATAAGDCIRRARRAGLTWPLPDGLTDEVLEQRLYPPPAVAVRNRRPRPNWAAVHRELRRPGVTLQLLWEEHRAAYPDGYGYSRFCELYRDWEARLSPTMRQSHVAGERMFVDYAGTTLTVIDGSTGQVRTAQLFVAVLGASSYTYAEATWTQGLADWIGAHTRTFAFFGGVAAMVVSDNLRSGITKACFYEPAVNRSYAEMAAHYNTAIVPARPYRARDKAKVEVAVQVATRFIVAKLRNRQFFSLAALNAAIADQVAQINDRVSRHLGASRRALFEELERLALKPLPAEPYVFAEWKQCRVGLDYHVEVGKHYYSVPHQLLREKIWARVTMRTVEVFHRGKRVAAHVRSSSNRKHTTVREHMPSSHRRYADWTPERLRRQAGAIGRHTSALAGCGKSALARRWECDSVHVSDSFGLGHAMRGEDQRSEGIFSYVRLEQRVPADHPLRAIRDLVDAALRDLSRDLSKLYARDGRPSIPPERLLRALLLQAFFTVRSERQLMEQLDYNLLFRWFVGLSMDDPVWDATVFCKNRDRLLDGDIAAKFFVAVLNLPQVRRLLSSEHFSVDGTLIEAWASLKSFVPKNGGPPGGKRDGTSRNAERDFRREKRKNDTHSSTTDPDARLFRKGAGKEAKLCHMGHLMMENRNGLLVDARVTEANGTAERTTALDMIEDNAGPGSTVGGDKNYDTADFVAGCRERGCTPHISQNDTNRRSAIDARTTRHPGYRISTIKRKQIEEPFGWMKTVGGLRKTRHRGRGLVEWFFVLTAAAYNLIRIPKLLAMG